MTHQNAIVPKDALDSLERFLSIPSTDWEEFNAYMANINRGHFVTKPKDHSGSLSPFDIMMCAIVAAHYARTPGTSNLLAARNEFLYKCYDIKDATLRRHYKNIKEVVVAAVEKATGGVKAKPEQWDAAFSQFVNEILAQVKAMRESQGDKELIDNDGSFVSKHAFQLVLKSGASRSSHADTTLGTTGSGGSPEDSGDGTALAAGFNSKTVETDPTMDAVTKEAAKPTTQSIPTGAKKSYNDLERENERLRAQVGTLTIDNKKLQAKLGTMEDLSGQYEKVKTELEKLQAKFASLDDEHTESLAESLELEQELVSAETSIVELYKDSNVANETIGALQAALAAANTEMRAGIGRLLEKHYENQQLKGDIVEAHLEIGFSEQEFKEEIEELQQSLRRAEKAVAAWKKMIDDVCETELPSSDEEST